MDDVGAGGQHVVHFLAQAGEIGGKNRRGDGERLHDDLGLHGKMPRIVPEGSGLRRA